MTKISTLPRSLAAGLFAAGALASAAAAAPAHHPDLNGFWELRGDSKPEPAPRPALQPDVAERQRVAAAETAARMAKGILYPPGASLCTYRGAFGGLGDSAPTNILQTPREIAMFWESTAAPRHIYMDGRAWPDPKTLQASSNGYSIGHWEGDTLVVETRGFDPRHGQGAPGGRTLQSRQFERWKLVDGGKKLQVEFTFVDPKIYTQPYKLTWTYYRDPPDTYAAELVCDASDPKQALSVVPPSQD